MAKLKLLPSTAFLFLILIPIHSLAQIKIYRSGGGEVILSGADVRFIGAANSSEVNTNARFTLFFHTQQNLNIDVASKLGFSAGAAIRNVGLIMEDRYQYLGFVADDTHEHWDKNTKIKRRSYSLGFPVAMKLGAIDKHIYLYFGGEYEWMFHYKQKLFLDDIKSKEKEWTSDRVNPWIPSVFAGVQLPGGFNLKFKYYLNDFLNHDYTGTDFNQAVDYSQFESSGIWYISLAMILNKKQLDKMMENQNLPIRTAYR